MTEDLERARAVRAALARAQEDGNAISVHRIARDAGVYRSFILRRPDLLAEIQACIAVMKEEDKRTIQIWFRTSRHVLDLIDETRGESTVSQFIWEAVLEKLAKTRGVSVKDIDPAQRVPTSPNRRKCGATESEVA
jgi:hypothetical protein